MMKLGGGVFLTSIPCGTLEIVKAFEARSRGFGSRTEDIDSLVCVSL